MFVTSTSPKASCASAAPLARVDGTLTVTAPKTTRSARFIPMSAEVESLLRQVKASQATERLQAGSVWTQTGFVFTTETGQPCDPRNALRALKVASARAGLPSTTLHTIRHSAASLMLVSGVPLKVVSDVLGHASVARSRATCTATSPPTSHGLPSRPSAPPSKRDGRQKGRQVCLIADLGGSGDSPPSRWPAGSSVGTAGFEPTTP